MTLESRQVLSHHHHHQCFADKVVAIIDVDELVQKNVVPSTVVVDIIMTSYEYLSMFLLCVVSFISCWRVYNMVSIVVVHGVVFIIVVVPTEFV